MINKNPIFPKVFSLFIFGHFINVQKQLFEKSLGKTGFKNAF